MTPRQRRTKAIEILNIVKESYTETDVLVMMATLTTIFCLGEVSGLRKASQIVIAS